MPLNRYNRGPWYRGGVSRSYIPPTIFASVGCACCLLVFSVVLIIGGGSTLAFARHVKDTENKPPFDDPFFKRHRGSVSNTAETIGTVILSIGCVMLSVAIIMCLVAAFLAKKQEDRRHTDQQNPLAFATPQPPPSSAYPHQPTSGNVYPPAGSYPHQPPSGNVYPPPQPVISGVAGYYPPSSTTLPPPGNQYPPPYYTQPPNAPPQGVLNADDENKQPLEQKS